jgi:predicted SnoaL-like aldol condensation-catalyzing enzyme
MEKEQQQESSYSTDTNTKQQEEEEKKNEALALRYHNDIYQKGMLEVADEILSPDFVLHNPTLPGELRNGPEAAKKYASAVIAAVPDRKLVNEDIFAKGDKVLIRWTISGTNIGPLFGNPPTGKPYVATGFDLFRISNGKIMEMWQQYNFEPWP